MFARSLTRYPCFICHQTTDAGADESVAVDGGAEAGGGGATVTAVPQHRPGSLQLRSLSTYLHMAE